MPTIMAASSSRSRESGFAARARRRSTSATPGRCFGSCRAGSPGQPEGEWTFDGDESIRRRPVDRIADPLRLMGADVECRDGRLPPLRVRGSQLRGIDYEMPVASAQVKSCLLLAGLLAEGETAIHEPLWTRDHTERMLAAMGASIRREGDAPDRLRPPSASRRAMCRYPATSPPPPSSSRPPCWSPAARSSCARSGSTGTGSGCCRSSPGWAWRWAGRTRKGGR